MAGGVNHRHRVGVLPGLQTSSSSINVVGTGGRSPLPDPESSHGKQLVPLGSKALWNGSNPELRSVAGRDVFTASQLQNFVNRIAIIEESNKALLEEIYRLQTSVRGAELDKKGLKSEEKRMQHELMQTIRASNDVISELTSRMRRAEEKLHIDKEARKNIVAQTKQFEQALVSAQHDYSSMRDKQSGQIGELRHLLDDMQRRYERSDRTSAALVDEFRQMKTKLEMQGMDFTHLQAELRQRSKKLEEDTKQAVLETRFQKDSNSQSEQNSLQTRQFFEVRINELRDIISDLRNRVGRVESDAHTESQQAKVRFSELQSSISEQSHKRQEDIQSLEHVQQEREHLEENQRMKLQERIKDAVEEMSDKLLSKEVRLREEALQKFVELERMVQKEESYRTQFEKQLREENEVKWNLQQKLMQDELRAVKEFTRTEKTKQNASNKSTEESLNKLEKKLHREKKSLEKVLLAEITKRENQSTNILSQIDAVQEQLRVALSTLQQAIGGVQFQVTRDREQFSNEVKLKLSEEHARVNRAITDADSRLTSLAARITQQDETYELKINEMSASFRDTQTDLLHDFQEWRGSINKDVANIQAILDELPQEVKETQERVSRLKDEADTRSDIENEARRRDFEAAESKIRMIAQRTDTIQAISEDDHKRVDDLQKQLAISQGTLNQLTRTITDVRNSHNVRLNSECKMRLEETSAIKKELARLRMEIQPLLWQQAVGSRQFIKKTKSTLNEWGLYQCARWYDIKMRWLQLLQRARIRRRQQRVLRERERTPSPGLEDDYESPPPDPRQRNPRQSAPGRTAWASQPGTPRTIGQVPVQGDSTTSYGALDLHGASQTPVRLDDDDDDEGTIDPNAWYDGGHSPTSIDAESHQQKDEEELAGLTQRIPTPQRPSVPGSEADITNPESPARSVTGSRRSLQQANAGRTPSQTPNRSQRASRASKHPSAGAQSSRQTPTRNSQTASRQPSQQGQHSPKP